MASRNQRMAFAALHLTLGLVVLAQSLLTLVHALRPASGGPYVHVALLAAVEALGALLFLAGRTVQVGGTLMLATFAIALLVHGIPGELGLLVYAAGTVFVMVRGSLWPRARAA